MWFESTFFTIVVLFAAIATGFIFSGWFERFRIIPVSLVSIGLSISSVVTILLGLNDVVTISVLLLQVISLVMMIVIGVAKLRHKMKVTFHTA